MQFMTMYSYVTVYVMAAECLELADELVCVPFQDMPVPHIHGPHSNAPPVTLPRAQTVEEIENSLLRKPQVIARHNTVCRHKHCRIPTLDYSVLLNSSN